MHKGSDPTKGRDQGAIDELKESKEIILDLQNQLDTKETENTESKTENLRLQREAVIEIAKLGMVIHRLEGDLETSERLNYAFMGQGIAAIPCACGGYYTMSSPTGEPSVLTYKA